MRETFLKALEKNEDDVTTRMVYADWLEENGEHEEADRQRKWPAAKAWLVAFAGDGVDEDSTDEYQMPYAVLLDRARESADEGEFSFSCYTNESMSDNLNKQRVEFWKNVAIVLGIQLPDDLEDKAWFGCAC